jgi:KamA family protein
VSITARVTPTPRYTPYTTRHLDAIPQLRSLPESVRRAMKAVTYVLPFRTNSYVVDELIDWNRIPDDPIYQLTFPQPDMLAPADLERMTGLIAAGLSHRALRDAAREIQLRMNPHPAGQVELNVPKLDGESLPGMQHKYRETVLFFPSQGQTCHAYCSYCFRWPQFMGLENLKFASREATQLASYVRRHPEISSILLTGGDPMIMKTAALRRYVEPLLELEHVTSIRIGSKALAYWPYRFLTDDDADDLLRLFEEVSEAGKLLAFMAHFSHPVELDTSACRAAVRRLRDAGVVIRSQAPLIRHVNDEPRAWAEMWREQVRLGVVPYYMFVERDTGPKHYFEVPLARALEVYQEAFRYVSGLERTVRGPSMSAKPGKVAVTGVAEVGGEPVFALSFIQGRDPRWVGRTFFARYDEQASWLDDLEPAFGEPEFFFEEPLRRMESSGRPRPWLAPAQPPR